jgi:single-strand DNA-binding protein
MNKFEMAGTIIEIFPAQTFGKGFRKREFVLEVGDKYPQKIIFQLVQEKCNIIDAYSVGDQITVGFNVTGRDWTDKTGTVKYFNALEAWRIVGEAKSKTNFEDDDDSWMESKPKAEKPKSTESFDWSDDDLPF